MQQPSLPVCQQASCSCIGAYQYTTELKSIKLLSSITHMMQASHGQIVLLVQACVPHAYMHHDVSTQLQAVHLQSCTWPHKRRRAPQMLYLPILHICLT